MWWCSSSVSTASPRIIARTAIVRRPLTNSRRSLNTCATVSRRGMFSLILRSPVMRSSSFCIVVTISR